MIPEKANITDRKMTTTYVVVYAPIVGYDLTNDTGKRFKLASEAERYVLSLRKRGIYAWSETEVVSMKPDPFDKQDKITNSYKRRVQEENLSVLVDRKEKDKTDAMLDLLQAFVDAVKVAGPIGAPAGHMYAAIMDKCSLEQFEQIMRVLVKCQKVRKQGDLYFWLADWKVS